MVSSVQAVVFCATLLELMLKGNIQCVTLPCQDPVFANGRIIRFDVKIQDQKDEVKNGSWEWESIPANRSETYSSTSQQKITVLKKTDLPDTKWVQVYVTASNSAGTSAAASLFIPEKARGRCSWWLSYRPHSKGTPAMYHNNEVFLGYFMPFIISRAR